MFGWPFLRIGGRIFLHGLDVTANERPSWPQGIVCKYDDAANNWCARVEREAGAVMQDIPNLSSEMLNDGSKTYVNRIDDIVSPDSLFRFNDDPPELCS